jgi:AraC-like DNA-binding protein
MRALAQCQFDRMIFESGVVRVGAFRSHPSHPSFRDSGASRNFCFVFPRTAVEIQHEHEPAFVANPNIVTFYNQGQPYSLNAISPDGDRCDWFAADVDTVRDVVRCFDPNVDARPEAPFRLTHGRSEAHTYLLQRRLFHYLAMTKSADILAVEETVIGLLEEVVRSAYARPTPACNEIRKQRDLVHHLQLILSTRLEENLALLDVASQVRMSPYHLCRIFHRSTGTTLHDYRRQLRLRTSLEKVVESTRPLVDVALDAGFSSHSHFTSAFHREFAQTPSTLRDRHSAIS